MNSAKDIANAAEARFARYLKERGYTFDREPDLGIKSRPDFLITVEGDKLVAEVKAFDTYGIFKDLEPGQLGSRDSKQALKPVRNQISSAADQLRDLRDRGLPLVVVLDNPAARPIPLSAHMVMSAMYGDLEMQAPVLPDGSLGAFRGVAGRNGKLRNDHAYVSAVAVVRREDHAAQWAAEWFDAHRADFGPDDTQALVAAFAEASQHAPQGDEIYLEVFETFSESAIQLPRAVFNGPRDLRWVPNSARTGLVPLTDLEPSPDSE